MLLQTAKERRLRLFGKESARENEESARENYAKESPHERIKQCDEYEQVRWYKIKQVAHRASVHPRGAQSAQQEASRLGKLTEPARQFILEIAKADLDKVSELAARLANELALEKQFTSLADQWERETSPLSSPTRKAAHPAYREIVNLGKAAPELVAPLILRRMKRRGGHWFWALSEITRDNPIPPEAHGNVAAMREAWLQWGSERGYC